MKLLKSVLVATALALATSTAAMGSAHRRGHRYGARTAASRSTAGAAAAIKEVGYANVFEGLTRIGPDGSVQPGLAESWEISDDGTVYTFKLHTGVKFHDGADFSAEDVKFSIDRAMAEDSVNPQKGLYSAIESVEVVDPATVVVNLNHPQGAFLWNMGWGEAAIVSPASADGNKERPIGTGPFKFDNWAKGSSITLVKNPDYWGRGSCARPRRVPHHPRLRGRHSGAPVGRRARLLQHAGR
jgi:peptide/nickel transport system substrate-binding protein